MYKFKQIHWVEILNGIITSSTCVGHTIIYFRLMCCIDGSIKLIDMSTAQYKTYMVDSVDAGKKKAQHIFEEYCHEVMNDILEK